METRPSRALKPQAVQIEPKDPKMIGDLDPETIEHLTTLARRGLWVAGQQETALAAFDLLCRDAAARGLQFDLKGATKDREIKERIRKISAAHFN